MIIPNAVKKDPFLFKRFNDRRLTVNDENGNSSINDNTVTAIPAFNDHLNVKSMDLSEIGFKERYQSTLTSKHQRARNYIYENDEAAAAQHEKSNKDAALGTGGAGTISNDYYMLAEKEDQSPQPY